MSASDILCRSNEINKFPTVLFNFAHKALLQTLPTAANLVRWKRITDPSCSLCKSGLVQTNKHVLSNCPSQTALQRYTDRHNAILYILVNWLSTVLKSSQKLFADIEFSNVESTSELFSSLRPDITVLSDHLLITTELTICQETNLKSSRLYKTAKYHNIHSYCTSRSTGKQVKNFTIEVSTLGLMSPTSDLTGALGTPAIPSPLKEKIIRTVLDHSFKIYCGRNGT